MIPWETIAKARAPDGGELVLYHRGGEFVIRVDGRELMSSRAHGSEEMMAELACAQARTAEAPRVLVGGLGLGYTLRAALESLPPSAEVTVVEIVPDVVAWNRGPLAHLAGRPLDDPRVTVVVGDVAAVVRTTRVRFDVILLDVDNGPAALTRPGNQTLYGEPGLTAARRALRRGGVLAVWSADPDEALMRRLGRAGFRVDVRKVPARGVAGGPNHSIFLGFMG
jgi:spermidine synthase